MSGMATAGEVVRAAMVSALLARPEFAGIDRLRRETSPNALPQAGVDAGTTSDWSTKDAPGREIRLTTTIRVARGQALRLPMMVAAVEAAGGALGGDLGGWQVASAVLQRSRSFDAPDGTRVAIIEHRVRVLAA